MVFGGGPFGAGPFGGGGSPPPPSSDMTAFTKDLSFKQGRRPADFSMPFEIEEGSFFLVLGTELSKNKFLLEIGDYVQVDQDFDPDGANLLRFRVMIRPVLALPLGYAWRFGAFLDGVERIGMNLDPSRTRRRRLIDMAINVAGLIGTHNIAFVLGVVAS